MVFSLSYSILIQTEYIYMYVYFRIERDCVLYCRCLSVCTCWGGSLIQSNPMSYTYIYTYTYNTIQ
jgi:hypothetical protein